LGEGQPGDPRKRRGWRGGEYPSQHKRERSKNEKQCGCKGGQDLVADGLAELQKKGTEKGGGGKGEGGWYCNHLLPRLLICKKIARESMRSPQGRKKKNVEVLKNKNCPGKGAGTPRRN